MEEKDYEILSELRESLNELVGAYSTEYTRQRESLKFEAGDQWDEAIKQKRMAKSRPVFVNNMTKPYVDRIVNPFILNPISVNIDESTDISILVKEMVSQIETGSNANEAYQTAFRNAVTCGRGFFHIGTYYADDVSMDQEIRVDCVRDPLSCYLDPASEEIDGSDATYGVWVKYISENIAKNLYGVESCDDSLGVYDNWKKPDKSVASLLYYKKKVTRKRRQFMEDGSYIDMEEDYPQSVRSRRIEEPTIECYHIVGQKVVSKTEYKMPYIPIIPVYGNRQPTDNGFEYGGIVDQVKHSQQSINFYASSEAELVALSPKAPWVAAIGQTKGVENIWKNANTELFDVLTYVPEAIGGQLLPPPQRADNTAQTQGLIASKQNAQQDMARETAIFDPMFGQYDTGTESGKALQTRNVQGEIATAHYTDNIHKSVKHGGRVMMWLMNNVYDTPRTVTIDDNDVSVTFTQLGLDINKFKFDVVAGPSIESKKEQSIQVLTTMMQMNPQAAPLLSIRIAENLNVANKNKIVEDLKKLLPPELKDEEAEAPDPMAMQALQTAQATINELQQQNDYFMGLIRQFQTMQMNDEANRQERMAIAELKARTDLAKEEMSNNTELAKAEIAARVKMDQETLKQIGDSSRQQKEISADAEKDNREIIKNVTGTIANVTGDIPDMMEDESNTEIKV